MGVREPLIADVVFVQLPKGRDELRTALHGLSPRARQLLQLIDGERSAIQLRRMFAEPELAAYLALLEVGAFITPAVPDLDQDAAPSCIPIHALSEAACRDDLGRLRRRLLVELLSRIGPAAEPFALAITRSPTVADLRRLIPAICSAIEVGEGPERAQRFAQEMIQA